MVEVKKDSRSNAWKIAVRALKATIKGALFYAVYFVAWMFLAPLSTFVPGLQQTIEAFVAVYITLMIIGELTSGTIYAHFFNMARALFVILYLILSLKGGMFSLTVQNISLMIDLSFFITIAMLLSLLGVAKSVLQAINYMSQKAENTQI